MEDITNLNESLISLLNSEITKLNKAKKILENMSSKSLEKTEMIKIYESIKEKLEKGQKINLQELMKDKKEAKRKQKEYAKNM